MTTNLTTNLTGSLRRRLVIFLSLGAGIVLLAGGALAAFENSAVGSYWDGLYWALSLMTTVGFIGGSPQTTGGRIVAAGLMVSGFAMMTLVTAAISSLFIREQEQPEFEEEDAFESKVLRILDDLAERIHRIEAGRSEPVESEGDQPDKHSR
ncbi:MAG: kcsA [Nocardioides sp.]|nr:kcsA [Nocardioides sp.]